MFIAGSPHQASFFHLTGNQLQLMSMASARPPVPTGMHALGAQCQCTWCTLEEEEGHMAGKPIEVFRESLAYVQRTCLDFTRLA